MRHIVTLGCQWHITDWCTWMNVAHRRRRLVIEQQCWDQSECHPSYPSRRAIINNSYRALRCLMHHFYTNRKSTLVCPDPKNRRYPIGPQTMFSRVLDYSRRLRPPHPLRRLPIPGLPRKPQTSPGPAKINDHFRLRNTDSLV